MAKWGESKLTEEEKKEREEQKKRMQEEKERKEEERKFNRQINYFVMRSMWQIIPDGRTNGKVEECFNMSRTRFTRIIDVGTARLTTEELEFLSKKTDMSQDIFKGERHFACLTASGQEIITMEEWRELFRLRTERRRLKRFVDDGDITAGDVSEAEEAYKKADDIYREAERDIKKKLGKVSRKSDIDFGRLYTFVQKGYGDRLVRLQEIKQTVAKIELSLLDSCTKAELVELGKLLTQKSKTVDAVLMYRGVRGDFKKK